MDWQFILTLVFLSSTLFAQQDRIAAPIDGRQRFALKGVIRPEAWPPGCSLVCCGQQMTALLPNASKPSPEFCESCCRSDQQRHRRNAPNNAQHGQQAAREYSV